MIDVKDQYQTFDTHLKKFEPMLEKYGYSFLKMDHDNKPSLSYESNDYEYLNTVKKLKIHLSVSVVRGANASATVIGFNMFGPKKEFFSLSDYQESRKPAQIKTNFSDDIHLDANIQNFFRDLGAAFETYLNDQITGRFFENHMDKLMDSYCDHTAVYDMQKQVVSEAIVVRAVTSKKSWLGRILKLFIG